VGVVDPGRCVFTGDGRYSCPARWVQSYQLWPEYLRAILAGTLGSRVPCRDRLDLGPSQETEQKVGIRHFKGKSDHSRAIPE